MGEPQFTPGPWVVHPFVARVDCQKISEKGGLLPVCQLLWPTDERTEQETEANARLIAAAPALYEALKDCHMRLQTARDIGNAADDAALAKGSAALSLALGEKQS